MKTLEVSQVMPSSGNAADSSANVSTQNQTTRKRVPFDGGNRFIKWFDDCGNPRKIPSYIYYFKDWERSPQRVDKDSVLIESDGKTFVVGQLAKEFGGRPTFECDKNLLAKDLFLVALDPGIDNDRLVVETLAIATPDTGNDAAMSSLKKLGGVRTFKRNGREVKALIRHVEVVDEGLTAWRFAYRKGLFLYAQNNAVLDLGGGTGIGRIITPSGNIIDSATVIVPGTAKLASKIAWGLQGKESFTPDADLIMDAIESGTYLYPTMSGSISFEGIFHQCRRDWLAEVRAKLKQSWLNQFNKVGEVLIVGGSAELARELDGRGRYKLATHNQVANFPQFINLYGLSEAQ